MLQSRYFSGATFFLPTSKGIELIDVDSVVRIQSISNYSKIYFDNGKTLVVAKVLKWFEENLSVTLFIRVHRTHIVNKRYIHRYMNGEGSKVTLVNGEQIDVSRRKKTFVLRHLCSSAA